MSCEGISGFNPACLPVTAIETGAGVAQGVASSAFGTMASFFASAATSATTWLWQQINQATTLDLQSPQLAKEAAMTGAIAAVLCVGLFLVQLITAALRGNPVLLGRAFTGLIISFLGSAFALATTRVLLGAVDTLSDGVVQYTLGTTIDGLGAKLALTQVSGIANPAIVMLLSLVVLAAVVMVWAAMTIRKLMILLAAVLAPLAFAGATADFTRGWVRRWVEFMAAMIASKLLLVIILSLGASVLNGAGQSGTGATQTATQVAGGSLILLLGGLAPWMAIRMFHFAGDSLYAAHSTVRQASAGAQSVISSPQKVAAMGGQMRAVSSMLPGRAGQGFGSGGGWSGGGSRMPSASPRPALAGWAAPSGAPAGPGGLPQQAGAAASTRGAAAATTAAAPTILPAIAATSAVAGGLKSATNTVATAANNEPGSTASTGPRAHRQASGGSVVVPPKQPPVASRSAPLSAPSAPSKSPPADRGPAS